MFLLNLAWVKPFSKIFYELRNSSKGRWEMMGGGGGGALVKYAIGNLSKGVFDFEWHMSIGSEAFSLLIYLDTAKFVMRNCLAVI